ncbi:hypothetical protein [Acidisoma silvae]|uniref:Uncharacterized protein n=1 Tax=Acidisoma silvae TaxID=2802396 RepID=A0A963YW72_9PROT|nr:hypothetical protein [Acidisoma silvae]MCB8878263.1 hypothetical protein [Acidisoma silvae]
MTSIPFTDPRMNRAYSDWFDKLDEEHQEQITMALHVLIEAQTAAEAARAAAAPPVWLDMLHGRTPAQKDCARAIRALPVWVWPEAKTSVHRVLRRRISADQLVPILAGATGLAFSDIAPLVAAVRVLDPMGAQGARPS